MILFPNAKINLGLHVLSKREDNFHNLETLMHPVGLCDILEFLPSPDTSTTLKCTGIAVSGDMADNLVYKAYLLLKDEYQLPHLRIHLHKIIPAGAGLGGGSSDAAFMLKGVNQMFGLGIETEKLKEYASSLGSDCSFFIENTPALASGKGEILKQSADYLRDLDIMIFSLGIPVSTAEAYNGIIPDPDQPSLTSLLEAGVSNWRATLKNNFETTIFGKHPQLKEVKDFLYENGAVYASMSGSGSALYGIFKRNSAIHGELRNYLIWKS